jgi:hypothetical protein
MSLCLGGVCKLSYWSEYLGKNASAEPSTKDGYESNREPLSSFRLLPVQA